MCLSKRYFNRPLNQNNNNNSKGNGKEADQLTNSRDIKNDELSQLSRTHKMLKVSYIQEKRRDVQL